MKKIHRWLKPLLCFLILGLLASCTTIPTDSTAENMSVEEAREALVTGLKGRRTWGYQETRGSGYPQKITDVRVTSSRLLVTDERGKQSIFLFRKLPQVSYHTTGVTLNLADEAIFRFHSSLDDGIDDVVTALYRLQQNAIRQKKDADAYGSIFAMSLDNYRNKIASDAAIPEEANKFKVQAEGAVRDKAFDDAADYYAEALKITPWWPAGHYNRSLVLAEVGDYEMAQQEMKYYLQLVPDAPNARAAQDKIYEWERKAK